MNVNEAIEEFLIALEADGLKESTLRWYTALLKHYGESHGGKPLTRVKPTDVRMYINNVRKSDYRPDTIHGHIRAVHRFWQWCSREYEIKNPCSNIRYPKQPKPKASKAASINDVARMLQACDAGRAGTRDRAIIAFLVDTGCRAAGLCRLKWEDVDLPRRRAYVTEKGDKRRVVFFSPDTRDYLTAWLYAQNTRSGAVFYNLRTGTPLTVSGLSQLLKRSGTRAKVRGRINPHAFRHMFGREFIEDGGDSTTLAKLMGHEDVQTTADYYAVFGEDEIARQYDRHTPMSKIAKAKRSSA